MDSRETHQQQQQNRNAAAAALADPTSTSHAAHNRSTVGALSQQQPLMFNDASPFSQQPWMQLGNEQRGRGGPDANVVIDGGDAAPPAKRGRPPGSRTKNRRNALGGGGGGPLTAHVVDVNAGEDIAMKFVGFVNQEPRNVCILSASGAVSSAVFLSTNPIGLVRLEGFYVITSMSGAFSNSTVTKTGNMYVSLAGPDCKVVGGCVGAGMLVAASPVKVIVGIFGPEEVKLSAVSSAPANVLSSSGGGGGDGGGPGFPQSQGPQRSSVSSVGNASTSLGNSTPQPPHHLPLWPGNNPQ